MINKGGGGGQFFDFMGVHSYYEGDIELMGVPPPVPPTRENPARCHIACSMIPISCKFYLILACWFYSLGSRVAAVSLKQSLVFLTSRFYVI